MPANDDGIGPTWRFPDGKLNEDDGGEPQIAVAADRQKGHVVVQFGTPVAWMALDREGAIGLAFTLLKHASRLPGQTISFTIPN